MNPFTPTPIRCAPAGPASALEHSALRQWFASLGAVGARLVAAAPSDSTGAAVAVVDFSAQPDQPAISPSRVVAEEPPSPTPAA